MSFEPPDGILDIGNATLRVGKLEVAETSGLNQGLLNIVKNNLLITENIEYSSSNTWGIKLPTTWVADFDVKGHSEKYVEFNFYNEDKTSNTSGYTLNFKDTSLTLKYDNGTTLASATIPTIVDTYRKVNIFFERNVIAVSIDGTRVLYDKRPSVLSRVISTTGSAFVNVFIEEDASNSKFKNLRIVNGRFISDQTSNIAFIGGNLGVGVNSPTESLDVLGSIKASGNVHVTGNVHAGGEIELYSNLNIQQVSNTATIKATSNVVTEFPRSKKLIKYPRVYLTSDNDSGYIVTSSEEISGGNSATWQNWKPFAGLFASNNQAWLTGSDSYPSVAGAARTSGTTEGFTLPQNLGTDSGGSATANGSWLKLQLPHKITLEYIRMNGNNAVAPDDFDVLGSNDDTNWNFLGSFTTPNPSVYNRMDQFDINATTPYLYYAVIIKSHRGSNHPYSGIYNLEYYGIPEYDPEAHGTDVTVKSYHNVPNTDLLDIYIDGQDYSTMPSGAGSVLDKSTNNRHGTPSNVTFNSTWKAFEIESASTSNITIPFNSTGGAYVHTIALWFLMDTTASDPTRGDNDRCIFTIRGSEDTGRQIALIVNQDDTNVGFKYDFYSADVRYHDPSVVANKWMHVALTYSGGNNSIESKEIYVNGIKLRVTAQNSHPLNLTGTENLIIGGDLNIGNVSFEGMVANFRMFNRVLPKDEIYQLYAYQKEDFGHSTNNMTLKAGRLGIGTSEPQATLDVRGGISATGIAGFKTVFFGGRGGNNGMDALNQNTRIGGGKSPSDGIPDQVNGDLVLASDQRGVTLTSSDAAGVYVVFCQIAIHTGGTRSRGHWARLRKNGVDFAKSNQVIEHVTSSTYNQHILSALIDLDVGDTVTHFTDNATAFGVYVNATHFYMYRISTGSSRAATLGQTP